MRSPRASTRRALCGRSTRPGVAWIRTLALLCLVGLGPLPPPTARAEPSSPPAGAGIPASLSELGAQLRRSVVTISASDRLDPRRTLYRSGFILSAEGQIVTTRDLLRDGLELRARLPGGYDVPLEVVGSDPTDALALLEIPADIERPELVPAALGDSDDLRLGEWVLTLGQSDGDTPSLAKGIVAGHDLGDGASERLIRLDIPPLPTFRGAPVIDLGGRVIGILTAPRERPDPEALPLSLAVPINRARGSIARVARRRRSPSVWLGVRCQPTANGSPGALILEVVENSPAERAKLWGGDAIVEFAGKPVRSPEDLVSHVAETAPGDQVEVVVLRRGERTSVQARIERPPPAEGTNVPATPEGSWGLTYEALTPDLRARLGLSDQARGFVVSEVRPRSPAARANLQIGDLLLEINRNPVRSETDLSRGLEAETPVLWVGRGDTTLFVALER